MLLHQPGAFLIEKRPMLDRRYTGAHGEFDSLCAMRMRRNLALEFVCLFDQGFQLFKRVLSRTNRVTFRQHAPGRARLDHVRSVLHLIANRRANLVWSICDPVFDATVQQAWAKTIFITVPTTNTKCVTRRHDARSWRPAFVDSLAQRHVVESSRC